MNKKQGKPLKMRLFFFLVTHIDGNAQTPHQRPPGAEPFPNPLVFLGTQILGGIIGDAVADGGK